MNDNFIVAVGSSAGGLEAMKSFFDCTPHNHATYIILRHIPVDHRSELHLILQNHSKLRIVEAEDNTVIQHDIVYIPPASVYMTIQNDSLLLHPRFRHQSGINMVIDVFLTSLAESSEARSIAVILSGMGSDGSKGAAAIKAAGGLVIAQTPGSCMHDSMPLNVINSGTATYTLNTADMPAAIRMHIDRRMKYREQEKNR